MSPVVWSNEGPVPEEGVFPLCRVQLNLSFVPCSKPHKDTSKVHVNSRWRQWRETNECSRYLLNWLEMLLEPVHFRLLYFQSRWLSLFGVVSRWVFSLAVLFLRLIFYHLLIGVPKTKITSSNSAWCLTIQGYEFEYVPTPLASGGVGMFIYETLNHKVIEKTSNEAFQALWIEMPLAKKKNVICRVTYRQRNSPDLFQRYFEETIEKLTPTGSKFPGQTILTQF